MTDALLWVDLVLLCVLIVLAILRGSGGGKLETRLETLDRSVRDEFSRGRQETSSLNRDLREETQGALKNFSDTVQASFRDLNATVEKRLEQMRQTVDEKLQTTLETKLGESFRLVSERLEKVSEGLGEMQSLASGVGDLKKVLTNVKTRGTWGEVQLGNLLAQILTPDQYAENVATKGGSERVEFAIKLPGREDPGVCWLPVDAKFPVEDYQRIVEASERGDAAGVEAACKQLENTVKLCAKAICEKYLEPPQTTDFGILYLATEGLYAEALRRTGLCEVLQRDYRVVLAGPSSFAALLNSLQMGFRTLAIQRRSGEVWDTLSAVKVEFTRYALVLEKIKKKLQEASNTVEDAEVRTRAIHRKLRDVEAAETQLSFDEEELLAMDGDTE